MKTADLIARLSADLRPVPRGAAARRLGWPVAVGVVVALAIVLLWLGARDLGEAVHTWPFWMKFGYTGLLAYSSVLMALRASRPGMKVAGGAWPAAAALAVMLILAGAEYRAAPADARLALWLGGSWHLCPWRILVFAAPIYAAAVIGMRRLAPTRPVAAGAAAGFLAGALGAAAYQLACPETGAMFVTTWYTLGVTLSAMAGAALGAVTLRWRP